MKDKHLQARLLFVADTQKSALAKDQIAAVIALVESLETHVGTLRAALQAYVDEHSDIEPGACNLCNKARQALRNTTP